MSLSKTKKFAQTIRRKNYRAIFLAHKLKIIGVSITLILLLVVSQRAVSEGVLRKQAEQRAKTYEAQALILNLPAANSLKPGVSAEGSFVVASYSSAQQELKELNLDRPNIIDWLLSPIFARKLSTDFSYSQKTAIASSNDIQNVSEQLAVVLKFIEYNPGEDFKVFGKDKTQDDEHIEVTKQGFITLQKSMTSLGSYSVGAANSRRDIIAELQKAISASDEFKEHREVSTFEKAILASQQAILNSLQTQLDEIKNTYKSAVSSID